VHIPSLSQNLDRLPDEVICGLLTDRHYNYLAYRPDGFHTLHVREIRAIASAKRNNAKVLDLNR